MKKIANIITSIIVIASAFTAMAQEPAVPHVPIEVAAKGRSAVVDYLQSKLDHVTLQYTGASVVGNVSYYYDTNALAGMGYTHTGSFTELSDALSSVQFSQEVIPTPQGWYDVRVLLAYQEVDGCTTMQGNGWLNINVNSDGSLSAGQFQPNVSLNQNLLIDQSGFIIAAQLVGSQYAAVSQLPIYYSYDQNGGIVNSIIQIPSGSLESGYLAMAAGDGTVTVWDLQHGTTFTGKRAIAILGPTSSSDVYSMKNPGTITVSPYTQFYADNGEVFGRFPLLDMVTTQPIKQWAQFPVKVWGTATVMNPTSVIIKPLYLNDGGKSGLKVGVEYSLQNSINVNDGSINWPINIPAGGYHIEVKFNGVLDWSQDFNAKG